MTQKERSLEIGPECAFLNANCTESLLEEIVIQELISQLSSLWRTQAIYASEIDFITSCQHLDLTKQQQIAAGKRTK